MFRHFSNIEKGLIAGVDLADIGTKSFSVCSTARVKEGGIIEFTGTSIIGGQFSKKEQEEIFEKYEKLYSEKTVEQKST